MPLIRLKVFYIEEHLVPTPCRRPNLLCDLNTLRMMVTHVSLNQNTPIRLGKWNKQASLTHVLAGGTGNFLKTDSGQIILQQYTGRGYLIIQGSIKNFRNTWISFHPQTTGLHFLTPLKGPIKVKGTGFNQLIKPGYYLFYNHQISATEVYAKRNEEYKFILITIYNSLLKSLPENISGRSAAKPGKFTDAIGSINSDLINAPYLNETLHFFYENKVRELVFEINKYEYDPESDAVVSQAEHDIIHSIDNEMRFNPSDHRSLHKMSVTTGLTKYKLKEGFKVFFGMGLFERLLYWRIELACKLLSETNKPIKEIAFIAGYKRTTSFITMFRKNKGHTPREYRIKVLKGNPTD